jgi:hypothetical protein
VAAGPRLGRGDGRPWELTADRYDHPHLSVYDRGGLWRHGEFGLNPSGATERVLDPQESRDYDCGSGEPKRLLAATQQQNRLLGELLRELVRQGQQSPAATGVSVAQALNGVAAAGARAGRHEVRRG